MDLENVIYFAIIHIVLNTSQKWIRNHSIYLIACMNGWLVSCPCVCIGKYDIWTHMVLKSKNSKDNEILPTLDWKFQVVLNLIIELLASHWKVSPNVDILCNIPNLINRRILIKRGLLETNWFKWEPCKLVNIEWESCLTFLLWEVQVGSTL
jgi:hypothetical protein